MSNELTEAVVKPPTTQEFVEMGKRASAEIKTLRNHIAQLAPKAEAYDNIARVLALLPQRSSVVGEDVAWMIDRRIKELTP